MEAIKSNIAEEISVLAIDMGGTAIKIALFDNNGYEKKRTSWQHHYRDSGLENAKSDFISRCKEFCPQPVDAIGLSVAGLIATDGSLYRSTVLTSFTGFDIPEFLKTAYGAKVVTIDNDADCGAIAEAKLHYNHPFLYVVVGSGIGSAYVDENGKLPYLTRLDPKHVFTDTDNPIPNDLGLQVPIARKYVYKHFKKYKVPQNLVENFLIDKNSSPLLGPNDNQKTIRVSVLGSAISLHLILEILLKNNLNLNAVQWNMLEVDDIRHTCQEEQWEIPEVYREAHFDELIDETKTAKFLSELAHYTSHTNYPKKTFAIFGHFLGYGIAYAQKYIRKDLKLKACPSVRLAGPIMNSYRHFQLHLDKAVMENGGSSQITLAYNIDGSNLRGAYWQAKKALGILP